ncbi:MAG: glycerol-3-phosphate dehydrogenase, partial [Xanthomonadales bacterium]|nr:glycerol-3-phosphate dehydrogenase [Xanthomonadales bacterium]
MNLKAGLLGGGSWGTTVASLIARNAPVKIWARCDETVKEINESHRNSKYLPGATLHSKLVATHRIEEAVSGCDVLVMGVPSQH